MSTEDEYSKMKTAVGRFPGRIAGNNVRTPVATLNDEYYPSNILLVCFKY
jgi:hypothetical protein